MQYSLLDVSNKRIDYNRNQSNGKNQRVVRRSRAKNQDSIPLC